MYNIYNISIIYFKLRLISLVFRESKILQQHVGLIAFHDRSSKTRRIEVRSRQNLRASTRHAA